MTPHRRLAARTIAAAALAAGGATAVLLSGCATFASSHDYDVPLARLQRNIDQRFPIEHRALAVIELRLQQPRLATLPNDRIGLSATLSVSSPLMRQQYTGSLSLSGRLNIDQSRNAVMLADAKLDDFVLDGLDERTQRQVGGAVRMLADTLARDTPIYTWRPDELRYAGVQYVPTAIRTSAAGLSIHLEPMRDGRL
ncbi:DUF1439 domain-containing protein [Pseudoduganella violaceinigra]|uniref:DUF1439 domain-containing protein n=1 Tax=Pseudoduganella violaceinigra TaxID=246602 RepID=UPI0003F6C03A|nr:DUF1439 domain-containing protein [Pseudoduganella violaceinigra]